MLSNDPFKSDTITKETVMMVLRPTWEFTNAKNDVTYEFTFVVPLKKIYISGTEGDELDLTQSQLEVRVTYDPPEEESQKPTEDEPTGTLPSTTLGSPPSRLESEAAITDMTIRQVPSTMNDDYDPRRTYAMQGEEGDNDLDVNTPDNHSMPCALYVKRLSVDTTLTSRRRGFQHAQLGHLLAQVVHQPGL